MIVGYYKMVMEGCFVLCLVISMEILGAAAGGGVLQPPPAMYVFGDSTLDVGNNNYLPGMNVPRANMPYYGVDFPAGIPTGRFSNGRNTADFIGRSNYIWAMYIMVSLISLTVVNYVAAKMIGFVSSPPAYLALAPSCSSGLLVSAARTTGVSYASGGAGILDSTVSAYILLQSISGRSRIFIDN